MITDESIYSITSKTTTTSPTTSSEDGLANGQSMIVCAPTSSGKTLISELALYCAFHAGQKGIYLVSHKALADQKYEDFRQPSIDFGQSKYR